MLLDRLGPSPSEGSDDRPRTVLDRLDRLRRVLVRLREQLPVGAREHGQSALMGGSANRVRRQWQTSSRKLKLESDNIVRKPPSGGSAGALVLGRPTA
jgi:hypothetical protein